MAGLLIGLIGHTVTDTIAGWGIWWGWVLVPALSALQWGSFKRVGFSVKTGHIIKEIFPI